LTLRRTCKASPLARDVALRIHEKIKTETDLNASAGIFYNKFLAKLASDHRQPNGQYVISPEMGTTFVEKLPVGKFHGIGPATSAKMNGLGFFTGLDMRNQTLEFMTANFGKAGAYYYWISRGVDERPVRPNRIRKSVERTRSPPTFKNSTPWGIPALLPSSITRVFDILPLMVTAEVCFTH
jgi:DNA polymerase-4